MLVHRAIYPSILDLVGVFMSKQRTSERTKSLQEEKPQNKSTKNTLLFSIGYWLRAQTRRENERETPNSPMKFEKKTTISNNNKTTNSEPFFSVMIFLFTKVYVFQFFVAVTATRQQ